MMEWCAGKDCFYRMIWTGLRMRAQRLSRSLYDVPPHGLFELLLTTALGTEERPTVMPRR